MGFGRAIEQRRKWLGWSRERLAAMVGISERSIAYYEEESKEPKLSVAVKLAQALGLVLSEATEEVETVGDNTYMKARSEAERAATDASISMLVREMETTVDEQQQQVQPRDIPAKEFRTRGLIKVSEADMQRLTNKARQLKEVKEERMRLERIQQLKDQEKRLESEMGDGD